MPKYNKLAVRKLNVEDTLEVKTLVVGGDPANEETSTGKALTVGATTGSNDMTVGTGISTGTGTVCEHMVTRIGNLVKTEIFIDLTDLNGCGTAADIIGVDGETANCHIGQITAAKNGTIVGGRVHCLETPAGGNADVDLYYGDLATGAQDANIDTADSGSATQLIDHGAWTANDLDELTAMPAAGEYLYLVAGTATDADFTAGKFVIELWGTI